MKIYTAAEVAKMPDSERLALFEALGAKTFNTARFGAEFCRQSGWSPNTIANWRAPSGGGVPVQAILLLQEWSGGKRNERVMLEAFEDVTKQLGSIARTLQTAGREVVANLSEQDETAGDAESGDNPTIDESRL